jgi:histidinol-phosphate phosphatase family protein
LGVAWQEKEVVLMTFPAQLVSAAEGVLLDRDGTLVADVPYNGDPRRVWPLAGVRAALDRLRAAGMPTAVVSNQSGVGRGLIRQDELDAVNRRIEELLGPVGPFFCCPHRADERCACRKPAPGLLLDAARYLGVNPERCVMVGDIGSDMEAAAAAGAQGILVPTPRTLPAEISAAAVVARTLDEAVDIVLAPERVVA